MAYTYEELVSAYSALGVEKGRVVYATSDLLGVADFEVKGSKALMEAHYSVLRDALGDHGTLVVPSGSENLCNTDTPFDPDATPCFKVGSFSEFVRKQPGALRSFHPFTSYTAIGKKAVEITTNVSRHAYGPETPEDRLINLDALFVCIGVPPSKSNSTVHHVEHVMGVPYRYTKEFIHPVVRNRKVCLEPFYKHVWYRDIGLERDGNRKLLSRIGDKLKITKIDLGRGVLFSFSISDFYREATKAFVEDIYIWCAEPPKIRPYQK